MGVGAGLYMCAVVVQKFTFAISSPDEFLSCVPCCLLIACVDSGFSCISFPFAYLRLIAELSDWQPSLLH